jgi:putative transposase
MANNLERIVEGFSYSKTDIRDMNRYSAKKQTKERRSDMTCKVIEVKIDRSRLSTKALNHLSQLFTEAKWFYNYCLGQDDVNNSDTKATTVPVKVGELFEDRNFTVLKSGMKQAIKTRLFNSMSSLKALKEKGFKIGRLKFKGKIDSIPLKQFNNTFYIDQQNNTIRLQGMKQNLKCYGLEQLPKDAEIANATLVRKVEDFYLHITTFQDKVEQVIPDASVGIDFGCQTQLTFSNGVKVEFQVPPSKRLRRLDRKIMRRGKTSTSKNKWKDKIKRQKEYERTTNKKTDIRRKVVSAITKSFKYVCFQDESIHAWKSGRHGKKIQHSGIGGIMADLKNKSHTPLEVDRFFPSTQLCPQCGQKQKLLLSDRTYNCDCGFTKDRDVKSAVCIEMEGLKQIPVERRESTLGERLTSTFFDTLMKINGIKVMQVVS